MTERSPVVAVGLDAAEVTEIDRLCKSGKMPVLQGLRETGRFGLVKSEAEHFLSTVWPTFSSATTTEHHGWYFNKMWRPDRMRLEYANDEWLDQRPFWEWPGLHGRRMALLDIPYVFQPPRSFNGIFVSGWQTHDDFGSFSHPKSQWRALERAHGRPRLRPERFGEQTARTLLALRKELLASLEQTGQACRSLLAAEGWELFLVVLGGLHRGHHYLWDLQQIDRTTVPAEMLSILEDAREEVFVAADRALGRILEAAPPESRVLVFALHGMTANSGWAERFPALLSQVRAAGTAEAPREGLFYRWKRRIPWRFIRQVTTRLPSSINHALVPLWSAGMLDWSRTRFFALPLDINGYIRVNLRGREKEGIVEPGAEYDELLAEIEEAFLSFRAIETGEQVVRDVTRTDTIVDPEASRRRLLPDLVVRFLPIRTQELSGVVSERYGRVTWQKGAPLPSGRSGNHLPTGWFVASGPDIGPGAELQADSTDLVPTLLSWMGAELPPHIVGRAIESLRPRQGASVT